MLRSFRFMAVLLSSAMVFAAGCEKSSTSGTGGSGDVKAGYGSSIGAGKKLVGTWEGTDEKMKDKDGKGGEIVVEFKADGKMTIKAGPFDMNGTYKVTKEDGKVFTLDTEMMMPDFGDKGAAKSDKKTITITFENDNAIVMSSPDNKEPMKLKRKT